MTDKFSCLETRCHEMTRGVTILPILLFLFARFCISPLQKQWRYTIPINGHELKTFIISMRLKYWGAIWYKFSREIRKGKIIVIYPFAGNRIIMHVFKKRDSRLFDPSTLNCNSIVKKCTVCMKSVFIIGWTEEQMYLPI